MLFRSVHTESAPPIEANDAITCDIGEAVCVRVRAIQAGKREARTSGVLLRSHRERAKNCDARGGEQCAPASTDTASLQMPYGEEVQRCHGLTDVVGDGPA